MIAYCGYFGGGKTYHMTKNLYKSHKKGNLIVTNYNTSFSDIYLSDFNEFICFLENLFLKVDKAQKPILNKKKIIIGLDEGGVFFSARRFKNFPPILLDFIPQLRKLGIEIFYTVQNPFLMDVNFRRLTEMWRVFYKIHPSFSWGWSWDYLLNPENPDLKSMMNGNERLNKFPSLYMFNGKYFKMYNTYQILKTNQTNPLFNQNMSNRIDKAIEHIRSINNKESSIRRLLTFQRATKKEPTRVNNRLLNASLIEPEMISDQTT